MGLPRSIVHVDRAFKHWKGGARKVLKRTVHRRQRELAKRMQSDDHAQQEAEDDRPSDDLEEGSHHP